MTSPDRSTKGDDLEDGGEEGQEQTGTAVAGNVMRDTMIRKRTAGFGDDDSGEKESAERIKKLERQLGRKEARIKKLVPGILRLGERVRELERGQLKLQSVAETNRGLIEENRELRRSSDEWQTRLEREKESSLTLRETVKSLELELRKALKREAEEQSALQRHLEQIEDLIGSPESAIDSDQIQVVQTENREMKTKLMEILEKMRGQTQSQTSDTIQSSKRQPPKDIQEENQQLRARIAQLEGPDSEVAKLKEELVQVRSQQSMQAILAESDAASALSSHDALVKELDSLKETYEERIEDLQKKNEKVVQTKNEEIRNLRAGLNEIYQVYAKVKVPVPGVGLPALMKVQPPIVLQSIQIHGGRLSKREEEDEDDGKEFF
jgi:myosin heavy subunit